MPLPCSPVSQSAGESSNCTSDAADTSDDSLTTTTVTPRPGPSDPAKRTISRLSKPAAISALSSSPTSTRSARSNRGKEVVPLLDTVKEGLTIGEQQEGRQGSVGAGVEEQAKSNKQTTRQPSITFLPETIPPKSIQESSYVLSRSPMSNRGESPRGRSVKQQELGDDSSADESTAIIRRPSRNGYGTTTTANGRGTGLREEGDDVDFVHSRGYDGEGEERPLKQRKSGAVKAKEGNRNATAAATTSEGQRQETHDEPEGWFKSLVEKYGSVELENKGSVARDHLALERTFLAWLRTSLSFASIGIAVTQLFRLNTTISSSDPNTVISLGPAPSRLRSVGKPLGATFLAISILILLLGFHRYFESQHYVIRGKFPASRGTIVLISFVAVALIVASLIVVVSVAPQAFES